MANANFTIGLCAGFLVLEDDGTGTTITKDAESVVARVAKLGVLAGGRRILYRDSTGVWVELRHRGGRFVGFGPLGARTKEAAIAAAEKSRGVAGSPL